MTSEIFKIIQKFLPLNQIQLIVAYGSLIYQQQNYERLGKKLLSQTQIDLIVVVKDIALFHQENIQQNPQHYNLFKRIFSKYSQIQIFPYISFPYLSNKVKYTIVNSNTFINDLLFWESLIFAGRLMKPVYYFVLSQEFFKNEFQKSQIINLSNAILYTAINLKANNANIQQFFEEICKISYEGDIRFLFKVESVNKIKNIVQRQLSEFENLYLNLVQKKGFFKQILSINNQNFIFQQQLLQNRDYIKQIQQQFYKEILGIQFVQKILNLEKINIKRINFLASCKLAFLQSLQMNPLLSWKYIMTKRQKIKYL